MEDQSSSKMIISFVIGLIIGAGGMYYFSLPNSDTNVVDNDIVPEEEVLNEIQDIANPFNEVEEVANPFKDTYINPFAQ